VESVAPRRIRQYLSPTLTGPPLRLTESCTEDKKDTGLKIESETPAWKEMDVQA
jgi:hypothetical protein